MTISETAVQPAAGSHPYPDPHPLAIEPEGDDWATIGRRLEASWGACRPTFTKADHAAWFAKHWQPVPAAMYEGMRAPDGWITGTAPDPKLRRSHASADTKPDQVPQPVPAAYVPAPRALPVPEPETGPPLTRRQRRFFSGRVKPEPPVRDQPPAEVPETWQEPQQGERRGRHAAPEAPVSGRSTVPPPAAEGDDEPTLLPGLPGAIDLVPALDPKQAGRLARFNAAHDDEPPAGDWVDHDADRAERDASSFFADPDQGDTK